MTVPSRKWTAIVAMAVVGVAALAAVLLYCFRAPLVRSLIGLIGDSYGWIAGVEVRETPCAEG